MDRLNRASLTPLATAAAFVVLCAVTEAQWLNYKTPDIPRLPNSRPNLSAPAPRLPDGKPDLSGIWQPACVVVMPCWEQSLFFHELLPDTELIEGFCEAHEKTMEHRRIAAPSPELPSPAPR